jgi:hypothetical protein
VFEIHNYGPTDCLVIGVIVMGSFEKTFLMFNGNICFFIQGRDEDYCSDNGRSMLRVL